MFAARSVVRFLGDTRGWARSKPRHPEIWICVEGMWRPGTVSSWIRPAAGSPEWMAHIAYVVPEDGRQMTHFGVFEYDPHAIVKRTGDTPPG